MQVIHRLCSCLPILSLQLTLFICPINASRKLFPYLSAFFAASGIYETIALLSQPFDTVNFSLQLSITGFILFSVLGIYAFQRM